MTTGSSGLRSSGSYGSLQLQQFQNGSLSIQTSPPIPPRKPPKMFKEKEGLFHWIFKFAPRRKIGMLLLCMVSAAVFVWVLYVGKGWVSQIFQLHLNVCHFCLAVLYAGKDCVSYLFNCFYLSLAIMSDFSSSSFAQELGYSTQYTLFSCVLIILLNYNIATVYILVKV